ncbi:hypothetical protein BTS2_1409 [Bacillus sp. TS-2]|nr:hypothetical protein BTS2_1409 [Bacillus sp. TS-2]
MKKILFLFTLFCMIWILIGCQQSTEDSAGDTVSIERQSATFETSPTQQENEMSIEESSDSDLINTESGTEMAEIEISSESDFSTSDRKVIYEAFLELEVIKYEEVEEALIKKAEQMGGFLIDASYYEHSDMISGSLSIRIPQNQFQAFLLDVEKEGQKLIQKNVNGNDVTEEYVDLNSRLSSKKVVEERLLNFLDEAENTEDLLTISRDLDETQTEIEQLEGRIQYLDQRIDYSLVTINWFEEKVRIDPIQDNQSLNIMERTKKLFYDTVNMLISFFSNIIVFVLGASPVLVPLFLIIGCILYTLRKKTKAKGNPKVE